LGRRSTPADYFRARRTGRGRHVGRAQRAEIWQLIEKYTKRLDEKSLWTFRQVAEDPLPELPPARPGRSGAGKLRPSGRRSPGARPAPGPAAGRRGSRLGQPAPLRRFPQPASRCARPGRSEIFPRIAGDLWCRLRRRCPGARRETSCPPGTAGDAGSFLRSACRLTAGRPRRRPARPLQPSARTTGSPLMPSPPRRQPQAGRPSCPELTPAERAIAEAGSSLPPPRTHHPIHLVVKEHCHARDARQRRSRR